MKWHGELLSGGESQLLTWLLVGSGFSGFHGGSLRNFPEYPSVRLTERPKERANAIEMHNP
jgi:hypothetical protein